MQACVAAYSRAEMVAVAAAIQKRRAGAEISSVHRINDTTDHSIDDTVTIITVGEGTER